MSLKQKKYVYVDTGKRKYVKVRVLKNRDENSPDRYIVLDIISNHKFRKANIVKIDDIPLEVRDKITKSTM
ncbi:DUF5622 domain-containing protein [Acidianus brierleyi]|uniref:DUF5622 domain-containing protein n=1 Tax=Acidianus brierleyi TaxID=41673 RepID=UPI001442F88F|nr:DUF5622 domain-containing protein [Acidianus brierleyi]QIJ32848.1 hypothetical protein DFR85_10800 [Acidianus brierleyi]